MARFLLHAGRVGPGEPSHPGNQRARRSGTRLDREVQTRLPTTDQL